MKFAVFVSVVVLAGVATAFPENRPRRSPQSTIVEVIPVQVFEVAPIPSVLAFDFDAARAGKSFSPPIAIGETAPKKAEAKADEKKEVTKRDEDATEKKLKEEEMKEKEEEKQEEEEEELKPEIQIDVRVADSKEDSTDEKTEETPKE